MPGPYDSPLFRCIWLWLLQLDLATSGKGGIGNYIGICVIVAAFGVADAHVEGGMVGDLSLMCPDFMQVSLCSQEYVSSFLWLLLLIPINWVDFIASWIFFSWILQSFLAGLAASGALTSALRLITKAAFEKSANGLRKGVSMLFSLTDKLTSFGIKNNFDCCFLRNSCWVVGLVSLLQVHWNRTSHTGEWCKQFSAIHILSVPFHKVALFSKQSFKKSKI